MMIVLFIVLSRNKLRIPLEGTFSEEKSICPHYRGTVRNREMGTPLMGTILTFAS